MRRLSQRVDPLRRAAAAGGRRSTAPTVAAVLSQRPGYAALREFAAVGSASSRDGQQQTVFGVRRRYFSQEVLPAPQYPSPFPNEAAEKLATEKAWKLLAENEEEAAEKVSEKAAGKAAGRPPREPKAEEPPEFTRTRKQLQRLFKELPGHAGVLNAYLLHCRGKLKPAVDPPLEAADFEDLFRDERFKHRTGRRVEVRQRRSRRRDHQRLNSGYSEPDDVYEAEETEFKQAWRNKSIAEDIWKAEKYHQLYRQAYTDMPEPESGPEFGGQRLGSRTDILEDVTREAFRRHVLEQNRPVLTHELADFENPYMMKRSALERLLQERCVRNQLDERCMPRLLDKVPDLVKLRADAPLPPEVLEPLAAFRGDVQWHFDARERLSQKLGGAEAAFKAVKSSGGDIASVVAALPENAPVNPDQVPGIRHPWRNHLGFESTVPRGVVGGTKFGQPMPSLEEQVLRTRYPTLQRVAHTLPSDPKWRAHVVRTIRVLERSKDWDFKSKLSAVNTMKEVYDKLKPSETYTRALDEKLPLNRVPGNLRRKYAKDTEYVKSFPKRYKVRKSFLFYRPSLTAGPLKKVSAAKANFK